MSRHPAKSIVFRAYLQANGRALAVDETPSRGVGVSGLYGHFLLICLRASVQSYYMRGIDGQNLYPYQNGTDENVSIACSTLFCRNKIIGYFNRIPHRSYISALIRQLRSFIVDQSNFMFWQFHVSTLKHFGQNRTFKNHAEKHTPEASTVCSPWHTFR